MNKPNIKKINWQFILQSGFIVLISTYILLIAGTTQGMINSYVLILDLFILFFLAVFWLIRPNRQVLPLKKEVVLWVFTFFFSTIFSIDLGRSINQFILCSVGIFIFYFSCTLLQKGWRPSTVYQGLLFTGAIFMLFAYLDFGNWYVQWLSSNSRSLIPTIQYRPVSANIIALSLNLFLMVAISIIMKPEGKKTIRLILGIYILLDLFLLYLTSSRGGWLGTIAGISTFILSSLIVYRESSKKIINVLKIHRSHRNLLISGVALLTIGFTYILILQSNHPTHGNIFSSRSVFWVPALQEFLKDPLTGSGPFTFGSTFLKYYSAPNNIIYSHSHGTPVNLLTEMGIPGLAIGVLLLASTIFLLWKGIKNQCPELQTSSQLALCATSAFCVHSIFDCFHLEPGGLWILLILIAIPLSITKTDSQNYKRPWLSLIPVILLTALIWIRIPYEQGVNFANNNQWLDAASSFKLAVERNPASAITHQQSGITYAVLAKSEPKKYLVLAIDEFKKTIQFEPSWAMNYANLSSLYTNLGDLRKAQEYAELSIQKAPRSELFNLNLGVIAEENNDLTTALWAYHSVLDIESSWIQNQFWSESSVRRLAKLDLQRWRTFSQNQSLDTILEEFSKNSQSAFAYNNLAQYYLEIGEWDLMEQQLNISSSAYVNRPLNSIETNWLKAELFANKGDFNSAVKYADSALNDYHKYGLYGPGSFGLLSYAPRMFRSSAIALEIVPQFIKPLVPQTWVDREKKLSEWKQR